jgi:hypothetical protein
MAFVMKEEIPSDEEDELPTMTQPKKRKAEDDSNNDTEDDIGIGRKAARLKTEWDSNFTQTDFRSDCLKFEPPGILVGIGLFGVGVR